MLMHLKRALCLLPLIVCFVPTANGGAMFRVKIDPGVAREPCTGRLVVYLIDDKARPIVGSVPADAPFFEAPQPMFGIDVKELKPGESVVVDDAATSFPVKPGALSAGKYLAQVVLDMHHDNSSWRRESGNLYCSPVEFEIKPDAATAVDLKLNQIVEPPHLPTTQAAQIFETASKLLSDFRKAPVTLRAGVIFPHDYDPKRAYPAVYEIPGFGGDATGALERAGRNPGNSNDPREQLARQAFWIVLDPESGNGHTLFANSDNNGPCGDALVRELIPALESKFNLIAKPQARFLRGHSSGGWSALWLQLQYPEVFEGAWASSPDPVDLRKFEVVDIYSNENM